MKIVQTAERSSHLDPSENVMVQRFLFSYLQAAKYVGKKVLEIGSGEGYGMKELAPLTDNYIAVDKYKSKVVAELKPDSNIRFYQIKVPPLTVFEDNTFEYIVTFQVIEHIKDHELFIKEIYRVLKPEGKLIVTTPNIKMSLTRNPWHIREYTLDGLKELVGTCFEKISVKGVYGNEKVMEYYEENKKSVNKFARFDILNLQYNLPRQILQIPYDIMNRLNRRLLLKSNAENVINIDTNDFYLKEADDNCFDLFCIATK